MTPRSGIGVDAHLLISGRPLVLGGVTVPFEKGVAGHSDGDLLSRHGWRPLYVDATILAERPALKPFMDRMRQALATSLGLEFSAVNLKATTTDGLGFVGRGEGIGSLAIATVEELT